MVKEWQIQFDNILKLVFYNEMKRELKYMQHRDHRRLYKGQLSDGKNTTKVLHSTIRRAKLDIFHTDTNHKKQSNCCITQINT